MCEIDNDGELCEFWCETERKARKEHRCSSCDGVIRPGEKYLVHFSIFEREPCSEKLCWPCKEARDVFTEHHQHYVPKPNGFDEILSNCISDGDEESEKIWRPMLDQMTERGIAGKAHRLELERAQAQAK